MSDKLLKRSIVGVLLVLLFVLGLYVGNNTSYSINVDNENMMDNNANNDVLILNSFSFSKDKGIAGDNIPITIDTSGENLESGTLQLVRDDGKYSLSIIIDDIDTNPYIVLPDYINNGTYNVKSLTLVGYNTDDSTFTKNFTTKPTGNGDVYYKFNKGIELEANINNVDIDLIKSIKLDRSTFNQGEKVSLSIDADKDVRMVRLSFKHNDGHSGIFSYVNSIKKNPYIVIAKSGKIGDYVLDNIYVETYNYGSVVYKNVKEEGSKYLEYDSIYSMLQLNNDNSSVVYYNNVDIDNIVISSIKNSDIIQEVFVIAHDEPVVSSEVFEALIGSNKKLHVIYKDIEYIIDGEDIKNVKMFDSTTDIKLSKNYKGIDVDGLIVKLSGGTLPGKFKVVLKENSLFSKAFDSDRVNIYAYNEKDSEYTLFNENIKMSNKAYQFEIEEGNTYLLTNNKIASIKVAKAPKEENKDNKVSSGNNNRLLIIIAILLVVLIVLVVILLKRKGNDREKIVTKDIDFEDVKEELTDDISEEEIIENIAKANEESISDDE